MRTSYETMQCNGKLYNVHDILSLFCDFDFDLIFFGKHRLTVLLKEVIIHVTSSYLFCKSLRELPQSVCSVWFSHLTILEWRQWSHLMFNQSIEILGFVPFFLFKNIDGWKLLICPHVHLRLMHDAPSCPSVRLWGTNCYLSSWPCSKEPIGWELLICP